MNATTRKAARTVLAVVAAAGLAVMTWTGAWAMSAGAWGTAVGAESVAGTSTELNTSALEGCAFVAQRDDVLYFASSRAGGLGGLDIWYAERQASGAWGAPVNFTAVNSSADDLCPAAHRNGRTFLFASTRAGGCGGSDLYTTRRHETRGWAVPSNLGCGLNSVADEAGPSLVASELYFSSTRAGGVTAEGVGAVSGDGDIYRSHVDDGVFHAPAVVAALSTSANDLRPNLSRDGLEVFFDSNRSGGLGGFDLWSSTRASVSAPWAPPTNLGSAVNSSVNDLRPTLSWDGQTLYFGSFRAGGEGSQDLYVTTR
jgi:Tol biopolymer transport system component